MTQPATLLSAGELAGIVARLGDELAEAYPGGVVLVAVLKGSVPFVADLARAMPIDVRIGFLALSRFGEGTGRVRIVLDLDLDVTDRDVVVVEDVVDTGLTLTYLLGQLRARRPRSLEVCTLLDKASRRLLPVPLRFVGKEVGEEFVIGYGFDFAERYRALPEILVGDLEALRADPDAHVAAVHRGLG